VSIRLYRIDDRLVHGQVVVGWGQPLNINFIVLVDDALAASEWEQELYRMGAPPEIEVKFESTDSAIAHLAGYRSDPRAGILLTSDVETMRRLAEATRAIPCVNLGGVHFRPGRTPLLRYIFLSPDEQAALRALAAKGVAISAQDVPGASPVPLEELLAGKGMS
jgi:PTS system mannose-specific IIB component/fructoselysine and glucoselysine-specific PTS system IIB component